MKCRLHLQLGLIIFIVSILGTSITSCKQSADLAGNGLLQKRKYRTGFHLQNGKQKVQVSIPRISQDTIDAESVEVIKDNGNRAKLAREQNVVHSRKNTSALDNDKSFRIKSSKFKRSSRPIKLEEPEDPLEPTISEKTKK